MKQAIDVIPQADQFAGTMPPGDRPSPGPEAPGPLVSEPSDEEVLDPAVNDSFSRSDPMAVQPCGKDSAKCS